MDTNKTNQQIVQETTILKNKEEQKMTKQIEKTLFAITNEELQKLITKTKTSKLVSQELSTGISYFEGKTRIAKILKTKKSSKIEINIELPKIIETEFNLNKIKAAEAYKKHHGTMKYMATINTEKELKKLLKIIITEYSKIIIK